VTARRGHGWWPYLTPIFSFLLLGALLSRLPEAAAARGFPALVLVPAALLAFFFARGEYPELRSAPPGGLAGLALDFLVGVAGAGLWMAPYVVLGLDALPGWMRPGPTDAFDPGLLGPANVALALGLRAFGYGVVTPFAEELFVRGWLARWIEVFDSNRDFRSIPIGNASLRSFTGVVVFFTISHAPWEWPVAVAWIVGTQLWFYHRRHLGALVAVHAGSNLGIFAAVLVASRHGYDLWYFL
jgi:hypothetical protein